MCVLFEHQDVKSPEATVSYAPSIRSGGFADIGSRRYMEDEHIRIDDLSAQLGSLITVPEPSAFYGVSDLLPFCFLIFS